jgi:hypothetical protein
MDPPEIYQRTPLPRLRTADLSEPKWTLLFLTNHSMMIIFLHNTESYLTPPKETPFIIRKSNVHYHNQSRLTQDSEHKPLHSTGDTYYTSYFPKTDMNNILPFNLTSSTRHLHLRTLHGCHQLVEALRYKLEGRGFDSRWCHLNFSFT